MVLRIEGRILMKNTTKLILLGIIDSIIAVSGFSLWWLTASNDQLKWLEITYVPNTGIILAITGMVLASVTFFGLLAASESFGRGWGLNKGGMRGAIAGTILIFYFFVLSMAMFQPYKAGMPEQMKSMLETFTAIIGIMIPFYFGSSAYVQVHTKDAGTDAVQKVPEGK
jgi:hypothetical protein